MTHACTDRIFPMLLASAGLAQARPNYIFTTEPCFLGNKQDIVVYDRMFISPSLALSPVPGLVCASYSSPNGSTGISYCDQALGDLHNAELESCIAFATYTAGEFTVHVRTSLE